MKLLLNSFLLVMMLVTARALPQETDYDDYEYPEEGGDYVTPPEFLVEAQHLKAKEGESIVIPCQNTDSPYVLLIKRAETPERKEVLLFVDNVKVRRDRRYKASDDQMEITNLRRSDAGTYICSLATNPAVELRHTLEVEYPPKITAVDKEKGVHRGDSVKLECNAEGNPDPTIKWSKQGGRLPSGVLEEEGLSITLTDVDRHVEGDYVCTADNGIGEPHSDIVSIMVEYPPEIVTEKDLVRTNDGDTVELVCIVHARPTPRIEWSKDGQTLSPGNHIEEQQNGGHRNAIKITQITEEDFGDYVCTAENKFGVVESNITLSGEPNPPHFTSSPNGGEEESYTLTWETESYYPLTEYRLKYRKTKINDSTNLPGEWVEMTQEVNGNVDTKGLVHSMKHTLNDLEGATDYVAVVQIKNQYMWGDSAEFAFSTRKEVAQPTKISGASVASISSALLVLVFTSLLRNLGHC